jgi:L-threonylcarbamoyladenylate synthase
METKIFQINEEDIDLSKLKVASEVIKNKGLVAFPTETVYGLGANGLDGEAVNKIFAAKGRPNDNPLILHISEKKQVYDLTKEVPIEAEKLINEFWPGPLTVILKRKEIVPNEVTAGLDTVAIKCQTTK